MLVKYGESAFKFLKKLFTKARPKKGGPKATKNGAKVEKVQQKNSSSVFQKAVGAGGKVLSKVW